MKLPLMEPEYSLEERLVRTNQLQEIGTGINYQQVKVDLVQLSQGLKLVMDMLDGITRQAQVLEQSLQDME